MATSEEAKVRHDRKAQAGIEYMLVVSVLVIAAVAALWSFYPSFFSGMRNFADGSKTAITDGSLAR